MSDMFRTLRKQYDSLNKAIRLAKKHGVSDDALKQLIISKQEAKRLFDLETDKVLRSMTLSKNIIELGEGWYGVRYYSDKGDAKLAVELLLEKDLYIVERDGRRGRELSRADIDSFIPAMVDEPALEVYKQSVLKDAYDIVRESCGIEVTMDATSEPEGIASVSFHAGKRWVQRVLNIKNDSKAADHYRLNKDEIDQAILDGYASSTLQWIDKEDLIQYFFDDSNMMYVVGANNKIVTLYGVDFGFSHDINRAIVMKQLEVIKDTHDDLIVAEHDFYKLTTAQEGQARYLTNEIKVLEASIEALVAKRDAMLATREESSKAVKLCKEKHQAECDKLFKKWDAQGYMTKVEM